MNEILLSMQAVPGLAPILLIAGAVMVLLDIKKVYGVAMTPPAKTKEKKTGKNKGKNKSGKAPSKPSIKFYLVLPGTSMFVLGYLIVMAAAGK